MSNLNIKAEGDNEHHKIEGLFKALVRTIKMAILRDPKHLILPFTKHHAVFFVFKFKNLFFL